MIIICGGFLFPIFASTYYCSNAGSDQNTGATDGAALATLTSAATKLRSGDTLLLRRGDVFRDSLNLSTSANPVIAAYGPSNLPKPVISGSMAITGWSVHQGSIWVAPCSQKIKKLFADNVLMTLARYPDTGWLRPDTMTENSEGMGTVITCSALARHPGNAADYWTNAQIRWRRWSWWFETRGISNYDASGKLSLFGASIIHIDPANGTRGWGFYIDNKFQELDAPGEWFYDAAASKVYFYPPHNANPNTMLVEGACLSIGIRLAGGSVSNVAVRHQLLNGISVSRTSVISSCLFEGIGGDTGGAALRASWDIADSRICDNVFKNNLNIGISWYENSGRTGQTIIERDTLLCTGSFPGLGGSGTWHAVGILVHLSVNVQIRYNYIDKTGYAAILLGSDGNDVYGNIIKHAMWTLNDGGAIYTDCGGSHIRHNIIYDTKGDLTSSGPWYPLAHGIWPEYLGDYKKNVIDSNTVVRSGCNGIYLPNNFMDTVRGNVLFDNAIAQLDLSGQLTNSSTGRTQNLPQENVILNNVCYAASAQQQALEFRPEYNYGTMAGNYICKPFTDSVVSGYGTGNQYYTIFHYTLDQWRSLYTWADKSAGTDPIKRPPGMDHNKPFARGTIYINESMASQQIALQPGTWIDLDGNTVSGSIGLAPFTSRILICSDSGLGVLTDNDKNQRLFFYQKGSMITYSSVASSRLFLTVYEMTGRTLYRWRGTIRDAGLHTIDFGKAINATAAIGSGMYTYAFRVIHAGKESITRGKFCILR